MANSGNVSFADFVAALLNRGRTATIVTLEFAGGIECDVELLVHRTKDMATGEEFILSAPVGDYDPPGALPPSSMIH